MRVAAQSRAAGAQQQQRRAAGLFMLLDAMMNMLYCKSESDAEGSRTILAAIAGART